MSEAKARALEGLILGYLRSGARSYNSVVLVKVLGGTRGGDLIDCKVLLTDKNGNRYTGRVTGVHGSKGRIVKVRFKPNIPGQATNSIVSILCGKGGSSA